MPPARHPDLVAENAELRVRLAEAEDMLRAIRRGEIDALVMQSDAGPRVYTLQGVESASNRARGEMLEMISDAVIAIDGDRRVTYLNPAALRLFSLDASVALGKTVSEVAELHLLNGLINENSNSNGDWHGEAVDRGRDSQRRHLEATLMPRQKGCDGSAGLLATFRDITERMRAEEQIHYSEQLHRIAFDQSPTGMVYVGPDERFMKVNAVMCAITGYSAEELLRMKVSELTHPDDLAHDNELLDAFLCGGTPHYENDKRYVCKDGGIRWVAVTARMVTDAEGRPQHSVCVIRDITERKQAEAELRTSEQRYRTLVEATSVVTWRSSASGLHVEPQPAWMAFTGQTAQEMLGTGWTEAVHPEDSGAAARRWSDAVARSEPFLNEHRIRRHDAEWRWMRVHAVPIPDAAGQIVEWFGMCFDITDRKQAEVALRASEAKLRLGLLVADTGLGAMDYRNGTVVLDATAAALFALPANQSIPRREVHARFHADDAPLIFARMAEALQPTGDGTMAIEHRIVRPDRSVIWVSARKQIEFGIAPDGSRRPDSGLLAVLDMTEQKQAETALRDSEAQLSRLLKQSPAGIVQTDAAGRMILVNERWQQMLGYSESELLGKSIIDVTHPRSVVETTEAVGRLMAGGPDFQLEKSYLRKDGSVLSAQSNVSALRSPTGEFLGLIAVVLDITQRLAAENALRESEHFLQRVTEVTPGVLHVFDLEQQRSVFINRSVSSMIGYSQEEIAAMGSDVVPILMHPDDRPRFTQHLERLRVLGSDGTVEFEHRMRTKSGEWRWFQSRDAVFARTEAGTVRQIIGAAFDITERKAQEEHLQFLMKEVNHRSKNMLGLVQAVARQTAASAPQDFVTRFGERVQALAAAQDLLIKSEWKAVSLIELIRSQLAHFQDLIGDRIQLLGADVRVLPAAAQAIGMALHELATNAGKYGALSNEIGQIEIRWNMLAGESGGPQFVMSWTENGGPPVTEPTRRGFGSTVIGGMVKMSLDCDPEVNYATKGFDWRIACPADKIIGKGETATAPPASRSVKAIPKGPKRVLVVEDEALIAMEIEAILSDAGFTVVGPVGSVAAALALIERSGCEAAVLDINLGDDTAEPIARVLSAKATPFVTISGYSGEQQPATFRDAPLVSKPVRSELLVAAVRKCLTDVGP